MNDPIDYGSPLGISKREWTKVLGANLALLLLTYSIALVFTLCGSDFFLLNFHNDNLNAIEETLRGWGVFALVQIAFETIEATLIVSYVSKWKIKFWVPLAIYGAVRLRQSPLLGYNRLPSFLGAVRQFDGYVRWLHLHLLPFKQERHSLWVHQVSNRFSFVFRFKRVHNHL